MREALQTRCEQFIAYRDMIRDTFKGENSEIAPVCANLFCVRETAPDAVGLIACYELIGQKTGPLSAFRGNIRIPMACLLSLEENPDETFGRVLNVYQLLRKHFRCSDYLALSAFLLAGEKNREELVERSRRIFKRMNQEHPLLTSTEDIIFAVLMASSEKTDDELITDMEACYESLKVHFNATNDVQTIGQILCLAYEPPAEKVNRVLELYEALERGGRKYGQEHELATLAPAVMIAPDLAALTEDILAVDAYLETQKGYGFWGLTPRTRLMHATLIASDEYIDRAEGAPPAGALTMRLAQEMTMYAMVAATVGN